MCKAGSLHYVDLLGLRYVYVLLVRYHSGICKEKFAFVVSHTAVLFQTFHAEYVDISMMSYHTTFRRVGQGTFALSAKCQNCLPSLKKGKEIAT
jgi:hypothetical protein